MGNQRDHDADATEIEINEVDLLSESCKRVAKGKRNQIGRNAKGEQMGKPESN